MNARERPSWDEYFLLIANAVASRATCVKRAVGAVLVRDNHILSTGYNGPPRGAEHRTEDTCVRIGVAAGAAPERVCCSHAEISALALAAYHGAQTKGSTLYCTISPCAGCARALINAGVVRVVFGDGYPDETAAAVWKESGVEAVRFEKPTETKQNGAPFDEVGTVGAKPEPTGFYLYDDNRNAPRSMRFGGRFVGPGTNAWDAWPWAGHPNEIKPFETAVAAAARLAQLKAVRTVRVVSAAEARALARPPAAMPPREFTYGVLMARSAQIKRGES